MRVKESIASSIRPLVEKFQSLSSRERSLILGGVLVAIPIFAYQIAIVPAKEAFTKQTVEFEKLNQDLKALPHVLDRYKKFKARKEQLEQEFREVEIKEGEQSLLETILSNKVEPGFDISPTQTTPFGGTYEQASFNVRFTVSSLNVLVEILNEISTGKKRMLLTTLSLSKDTAGEKLRVELGVSSIRQNRSASA